MTINQSQFAQLCREASRELNLIESAAIGAGEPFDVQGIECVLSFDHARGLALCTLDLGDVKPGHEAHVYGRLLELQSTFVGQMDALFLRDPINDRILFTARMPLEAGLSAKAFVQAMRILASLAQRWQATVLEGSMVDYDQEMQEYLLGKPTAATSLANQRI